MIGARTARGSLKSESKGSGERESIGKGGGEIKTKGETGVVDSVENGDNDGGGRSVKGASSCRLYGSWLLCDNSSRRLGRCCPELILVAV